MQPPILRLPHRVPRRGLPVEPHEKRPPSVAGSAVGKAQIDGLAEQRTMDRASGDRQTPSISGGKNRRRQARGIRSSWCMSSPNAKHSNTIPSIGCWQVMALQSNRNRRKDRLWHSARPLRHVGPKRTCRRPRFDRVGLGAKRRHDSGGCPGTTIESSLAGLNQNSNDYLRIEVAEGPAPRDGPTKMRRPPRSSPMI